MSQAIPNVEDPINAVFVNIEDIALSEDVLMEDPPKWFVEAAAAFFILLDLIARAIYIALHKS